MEAPVCPIEAGSPTLIISLSMFLLNLNFLKLGFKLLPSLKIIFYQLGIDKGAAFWLNLLPFSNKE